MNISLSNGTSAIRNMPLWKLVVELVTGIVVFFALYGLAQSGVFAIKNLTLKIVAAIVFALAILALYVCWSRLFEKRWIWGTLTCHAVRNILIGMLIGILFFCAVAGVLVLSGCCKLEYASPHWSFIFGNLMFYLLVACSEEVIFRGIMFRLIDERFGMWCALGISAILFGLIHLLNPDASIWSSFSIAIEAGLLLGAAYKYSGSLLLPIGIHWMWNFIQGNVFGLNVSGGETEESILSSALSGPDLITGGAFGTEASIISVVLGAFLSALFIWMYLKRESSTDPIPTQGF